MTDCSNCKGHRRYVGGPRDGEIMHLTKATAKDYPMTVGGHTFGAARGAPRHWYELDYDRSEGAEAVYRYLGFARTLTDLGATP